MILTEEAINALATRKGGFAFGTLKELGVPFAEKGPLPWKHLFIGLKIPDEQYQRAMTHRDRLNAKHDAPTLQFDPR